MMNVTFIFAAIVAALLWLAASANNLQPDDPARSSEGPGRAPSPLTRVSSTGIAKPASARRALAAELNPAPAVAPEALAGAGSFSISAYCPESCCTGQWSEVPDSNRTFADGSKFSRTARVVAADTSVLPFGTRLRIKGLPGTWTVRDRGGAIKGRRLDLFIGESKDGKSAHQRALEFGRQTLNVEVEQ